MYNLTPPKTIFIDDKIGEIKPLLTLFSQKGIPYSYFDGKEEFLPQNKYEGIRMIISDINLIEKQPLNTKVQITKLLKVLTSIISEDSCSFYLIFWTQSEDDEIPDIKDELAAKKIYPIDIIPIKKPTEYEMKMMNLEQFEDLLDEKIPNNDSFNFLIDWENTLQNEVSFFTNQLSYLIKFNDTNISWDESAKNIFSYLAQSYFDNDIDTSNINENLFAVRNYLNQSFIHSMSNNKFLENKLVLSNDTKISLTTIAKLNKYLFFEKEVSPKIETGKLFELNEYSSKNETIKNLLITKIFGTNTIPTEYAPKLVGLIVTPQCDLAHPRFLFSDTSSFHRVLYGLKITIDENFNNYLQKNNPTKKVKKTILDNEKLDEKEKYLICKFIRPPFGQDIFTIQPFLDNNEKNSVIIFNFNTITTEEMESLNYNIIMMLKQNLVFDIQSKLANHVNRLGNSMLEFY